jgi:hypothetical protein
VLLLLLEGLQLQNRMLKLLLYGWHLLLLLW